MIGRPWRLVHRDIKPDNLMLKQTWTCDDAGETTPSLVLVDFGSATFARGGKRLTGFEAGLSISYFIRTRIFIHSTQGVRTERRHTIHSRGVFFTRVCGAG